MIEALNTATHDGFVTARSVIQHLEERLTTEIRTEASRKHYVERPVDVDKERYAFADRSPFWADS